MVRNNKGVTLTSLSVYIIVSIVILSSLTFLNVNFMSQIADLSVKSERSNEILKAEVSLINDLKAANRVMNFSDTELLLDTGVKYTIKYRANEKQGDQTFSVYELYRNNVLITGEMANLSFGFGHKKEGIDSIEWIKITMLDASYEGGDLYIKVGKLEDKERGICGKIEVLLSLLHLWQCLYFLYMELLCMDEVLVHIKFKKQKLKEFKKLTRKMLKECMKLQMLLLKNKITLLVIK